MYNVELIPALKSDIYQGEVRDRRFTPADSSAISFHPMASVTLTYLGHRTPEPVNASPSFSEHGRKESQCFCLGEAQM